MNNLDNGFSQSKVTSGKFPLNFLIIILAIVYVGFLLYQSIYFNYHRSQKINNLKKEILSLQEKQGKISSLIAYYKTDSFQELEARKKLGLKMPDEKVVKVDILQREGESGLPSDDQASETGEKKLSNFDLWVKFVKGDLGKS